MRRGSKNCPEKEESSLLSLAAVSLTAPFPKRAGVSLMGWAPAACALPLWPRLSLAGIRGKGSTGDPLQQKGEMRTQWRASTWGPAVRPTALRDAQPLGAGLGLIHRYTNKLGTKVSC